MSPSAKPVSDRENVVTSGLNSPTTFSIAQQKPQEQTENPGHWARGSLELLPFGKLLSY